MARRTLAAVAAGMLAAAGLVVAGPASPAAAATGFRVSGTRLLDARGNQFIMRGANHGHAWYTSQTQVWADMKNSGANTIRVVLTGGRYGYSSAADVSAVISRCKAVHMHGVYDTAQEVYTYIDSYVNAGLLLVVGEFGHWHSDGPVDEDAIVNHANYRGIGWLAWSWSGNGGGVEYLDMVYGFNVNNRSWWGDRIIWGTNGWKQTSRQATVYN